MLSIFSPESITRPAVGPTRAVLQPAGARECARIVRKWWVQHLDGVRLLTARLEVLLRHQTGKVTALAGRITEEAFEGELA